jgi:hypothetical protein
VSHTEVIIQVGGDVRAYKMPVVAFRTEMEQRGAFYNVVIRYHQALAIQVRQTTACNALHPAKQRCCRWLLVTRDRMGRDDIKLTHEFLAIMLGVRRPTVTIIAGALQKAGLISGPRCLINIADRKGLEAACCNAMRRQVELRKVVAGDFCAPRLNELLNEVNLGLLLQPEDRIVHGIADTVSFLLTELAHQN